NLPSPLGLCPNRECDLTVSTAGTFVAIVTGGNGFSPARPCEGHLFVNPNPTCTGTPPSTCAGSLLCSSPAGGTPPYKVEWKDSSGTVVKTCTDVPAGGQCCLTAPRGGSFCATATDQNGNGCSSAACCGSATGCGFTLGFWHNNNGRAILCA